MPKEMKTESGRVEKSTIWCYNNNMMMVSYADKKKKGTKVVLFLSTMYDEMHMSRDERRGGGGADVVDLTRSKAIRWPLNSTFLLDTVRTNCRTLYECNQKQDSNFEFTWNLGK